MSLLFVGDGHYTGAPGEAAAWRGLIDRALVSGLTHLVLLGDFFEVWVGLPGLEVPWHEEFFAPLREARARGVKLDYVVGNKDYFVEEWNARSQVFDRVVDGVLELDTPAGRIHCAHGDLVNRADRQYRAWRAFSRSAAVRALARATPRSWLGALSQRLERELRRTNRHHKSYFPEAELVAYVERLDPRPAFAFFGHFHVHRALEVGTTRVFTLPFLGAECAGLWLPKTASAGALAMATRFPEIEVEQTQSVLLGSS